LESIQGRISDHHASRTNQVTSDASYLCTDTRELSLNVVAYKYLKIARQFYFLGPNFQAINFGELGRRARLFITQYKTVAVDIEDRFGLENPHSDLLELLQTLRHQQSIIFVKSPASAYTLARRIIEADLDFGTSESRGLSSWLSTVYGSEWTVAEAARRGVAIHHGRVPRAVGQKFIREFNLSHIRSMICTSTLIEGVNSAAKNIIIFDKQINRRNYDFFTYSNIQGRAGRMFQHFIGKVFRYHEPPREEIVDIESPILKDPEEAPDELLIIVEDDDLTARMRQRIEDIAAVSIVSLDLLKRYATLGPEFVNGAAEILVEILQTTEGRPLLWRGSPDYRQLEQTCRFIWLNLKHEDYGATSWRALTYWINDLRRFQNVTAFLQARLDSRQTRPVDAVIDNVFKFLRACESYRT
jgi:hypothetical protein